MTQKNEVFKFIMLGSKDLKIRTVDNYLTTHLKKYSTKKNPEIK